MKKKTKAEKSQLWKIYSFCTVAFVWWSICRSHKYPRGKKHLINAFFYCVARRLVAICIMECYACVCKRCPNIYLDGNSERGETKTVKRVNFVHSFHSQNGPRLVMLVYLLEIMFASLWVSAFRKRLFRGMNCGFISREKKSVIDVEVNQFVEPSFFLQLCRLMVSW